MDMTYDQQEAYLDNVDSMHSKASALEQEAHELYARVESMAHRLNEIADQATFDIQYRAYQALLREADKAADAAKLARSMTRVALIKFIEVAEQPIFH